MGGAQYLSEAYTQLLLVSAPLSVAARLVLASLFAAGGFYKIRHPSEAALAASRFGFVRHARRHSGYVLGASELGLAACLVAPWQPIAVGACAAALAVSGAFVLMIGRALRKGENFPCACLPGSDQDISTVSLWRAAGMALAAAFAVAALIMAPTSFAIVPDLFIAICFAAFLIGLPLAIGASVRVWRNRQTFLTDTDWQWVMQMRATGGQVPALPTKLATVRLDEGEVLAPRAG